jgi:HTH-type transcriptional regulator / antitoxin HigA
MGAKTLNIAKYGALCAEAAPRVIRDEQHLKEMIERLEELTFKRNPTLEERELADLLQTLIQGYDDRNRDFPEAAPHEMVGFLLEERGLRQAALVPVIGSSAQVSDLVRGKRGISKAQIRKLAEFFKVSPELFL